MYLHVLVLPFLLSWLLLAAQPTRATNITANIATVTDSTFFVSKPGCPKTCGNVTVPYPFGIGSDCSIGPEFIMTCNTSFDPPKPYISSNSIEVLSISQTQVWTPIFLTYRCYNQSGRVITRHMFEPDISFPYSISDTENKVTVVGCGDLATLETLDELGDRGAIGGCLPTCFGTNLTTNCNGFGCCQSDIPKGLVVVYVGIYTVLNHSDSEEFNAWNYSQCTYAFIGEQNSFQFRGASDLLDPSFPNRTMDSVSMVLDFVVGNQSCVEAQKSKAYLCQQNTSCIDSNSGGDVGYICSCNIGYEGNPYLSPGCTDIDECKNSTLNDCGLNAICINTPGNFNCSCGDHYSGDGKTNGVGCIAQFSAFNLPLFLDDGFGRGSKDPQHKEQQEEIPETQSSILVSIALDVKPLQVVPQMVTRAQKQRATPPSPIGSPLPKKSRTRKESTEVPASSPSKPARKKKRFHGTRARGCSQGSQTFQSL